MELYENFSGVAKKIQFLMNNFFLIFRILDLQKDRYFETQSAKYWNSSAAGDCPNTDDSEGITLGSLGTKIIIFKCIWTPKGPNSTQ